MNHGGEQNDKARISGNEPISVSPVLLSLNTMNRRLHRALRFIGGRGVLLFCVGVASALLLSLVELALAVFLMVFLYTLKFIGWSQLPGWLPLDAKDLSPLTIWISLLVIGVVQAVSLVIHYEAKELLTEGVHARLRLVLGYRVLSSRNAKSLSLSEMNLYTAEFFPKASEFIFYINQVMSFVIQASMIMVWMVLLAPGESLVGLVGLAVMGGLVLRFNRITNRLGRRIPEAQADLEKSKVRIARNWALIRIFRIQDHEFENWARATFSYYRYSTLAFLFSNLGSAFMPVLGIITIATIILANFSFFHTPVANLVAFLYLFVRFLQMVANGSNLIGGMFTYRSQVEKAEELVHSLSAAELQDALRSEREFRLLHQQFDTSSFRRRRADPRHMALPLAAPAIDLEGVTFAWPGIETPILKDFSMTIAPGEQVGIVGPNGCGKSTLLGIILGALCPSGGKVSVGGQGTEDYIGENSHAIAYVGPDPYLIQGSVKDNLIYGLERTITEDEIWSILDKMGMKDFVQSLPGWLGYELLENGEGLSSGQKQRLAMARSFLRQPSLFIMDEPSANLDTATEECILRDLQKLRGRCTVVMVSHRAGMLKDVDRVVRMGTL